MESSLRISNTDSDRKMDPNEIKRMYDSLEMLTSNIMSRFQGIEGGRRSAVFENAVLAAVDEPNWITGNSVGINLHKKYILDGTDIDYLRRQKNVKLAQSILENASDSVSLVEPAVQSVVMRGLDLLSKRHPNLAIYRCHIFDSQDGVFGHDYSYGSTLFEDINKYALQTDFPVISILPIQKMVSLFKEGKIDVASEGKWDRDSIEIHPNIPRSDFRKHLEVYRLNKESVHNIKTAIQSNEWHVNEY